MAFCDNVAFCRGRSRSQAICGKLGHACKFELFSFTWHCKGTQTRENASLSLVVVKIYTRCIGVWISSQRRHTGARALGESGANTGGHCGSETQLHCELSLLNKNKHMPLGDCTVT